MKYSLNIRKEAEVDIDDAFKYYSEIGGDLAQDFLLCVEEALHKIQANPLSYRTIYKELRRIAIQRFPYRIFYQLRNRQIIVFAVFHVRRDPSSWTDRI